LGSLARVPSCSKPKKKPKKHTSKMSSSTAMTIVQDNLEDRAIAALEHTMTVAQKCVRECELSIELNRAFIEHFGIDLCTPFDHTEISASTRGEIRDAIGGLAAMSHVSKDFAITDRVRRSHRDALVISRELASASDECKNLVHSINMSFSGYECRGMCGADMRDIKGGLNLQSPLACGCHWCFKCYDRVDPWVGDRCGGCNVAFFDKPFAEYMHSDGRKALIEELMVDAFEQQDDMVVDDVHDVYAMVG
jgi:hypothetical protein